MPAPRTLVLTEQDRQALIHAARNDPRAYYRERCAALLKIADGASMRQVARDGLLQPRKEETVAAWVKRFETEGMAGLVQHPRRARGLPP